jgi:hypothetical protein
MTCSTRANVERHDEAEHRSAAYRAIAVSAIGLAIAGAFELVFALFTRSVGLLGDALHNLSDGLCCVESDLAAWDGVRVGWVQIVRASSVNAAATRQRVRASMPSS